MRLIASLALGALAVNADASVIKYDWNNDGDRLISTDTKTHLQWLSPSLFFGASWNEMQNRLNHDHRLQGYRYATYNEWTNLIGPNGLQIGGYDILNDPGSARRLTSFLGLPWVEGQTYAVFLYDTPRYEYSPSDEAGTCYGYTLCSSSTHIVPTGVYFADICNPIWISSAYFDTKLANFYTHLLVREVPEPTGIALIGLGIAGIAARRKRLATKIGKQ